MNRRTVFTLALIALALAPVGCGDDQNRNELEVMTMRKQARYNPHAASTFFEDGMASRPRVEGTITADAALPGEKGRPAINFALMQRGQQRYNIYCSMCHGYDGYGQGVVAQHGFPQPPSLHTDRLRGLNDDYIHRVITQGLGKMPPYADQIPDDDRWAITSYVRALQRSQHATAADLAPTTQPAGGGQ